jgi:spore coat protein CotH
MSTEGGASVEAGAPSGGTSAGAGAPPVAPDASAEIYDPERVPRFDIELPPDSVAALTADPDTYVRATFRYENETITDIGVRIKGEGSLRPLTAKAALKLKFDEFVDDQTFKGLRRLTLNNMVEDPSFLAERLAYHVFRAAELPAPRCNSALVYVNGQAYGLYANVEAEDKTFLRRWFESDDGNLYEEGQVDFVTGAEQRFDLETNEAANDRSDLASLIALVDSATNANFVEHVGQKLDMTHFLRFTAAEAAVNQWDMYAYTMFYPNNFRLYHDPSTQRFVFLPWGMDMSMKPFRDSGKQFIGIFSISRVGDRQNGQISAGLLFRRCLESPGCKSALAEAIEEIATVYESAELETLAARYYEQIKPHVLADPRKEYTETQFERGYQSLLSTLRGRVAAMRAEL